MPRKKKKSLKTLARLKAKKRREETPEQRAARLEYLRNYARYSRANETESERENRLRSKRRYANNVRKGKADKLRKQRFAMIIDRCHDGQDAAKLELGTSEETETIYLVTKENEQKKLI